MLQHRRIALPYSSPWFSVHSWRDATARVVEAGEQTRWRWGGGYERRIHAGPRPPRCAELCSTRRSWRESVIDCQQLRRGGPPQLPPRSRRTGVAGRPAERANGRSMRGWNPARQTEWQGSYTSAASSAAATDDDALSNWSACSWIERCVHIADCKPSEICQQTQLYWLQKERIRSNMKQMSKT